MPEGKPAPGTRKVTAGGLGGATATIIVSLLNGIIGPMSVELTTAIGSIVTSIFVYLTSETFT